MRTARNDEDWAARIGGFAHRIGEVHLEEVDFAGMDSDQGRLIDELGPHGMTKQLAARVVAWARANDAFGAREADAAAAYAIRFIVARICAARSPRVMAEAARIALDFRESNADSVRVAAGRCGVSAWGLKKLANGIREAFRLRGRTSFEKSEVARAAYRATNGRRPRSAEPAKFTGPSKAA